MKPVRISAGFNRLEMYATSNGKTLRSTISQENISWQTIRINNIIVRKGVVEIGFLAEGQGGAFCYVDDVVFEK